MVQPRRRGTPLGRAAVRARLHDPPIQGNGTNAVSAIQCRARGNGVHVAAAPAAALAYRRGYRAAAAAGHPCARRRTATGRAGPLSPGKPRNGDPAQRRALKFPPGGGMKVLE